MIKYGKRILAAILSFTMTLTLFQGLTLIEAKAAEVTDDLVVHYDMSHADGKLTDLTGNEYNAALKGFTDSDFTTDDSGNVLKFDGSSSKYVEIPSGTITGETFTIEATFQDNTKSSAWLLTLGTTIGAWPNVANYLFVSPISSDGNYANSILAAIKNSSTELRVPKTKLLTPSTTYKNVLDVVFDNGNVTYYLNGEASEVTASGYKIQDILSANSTDSCIGYIGKSLYSADAAYKGTLSDFKIYSTALTSEQINQNYSAALGSIVTSGLLDTILSDNSSADAVTKSLSFPSEINGVSLTWSSSDATVIGDDGTYHYTGSDPVTITITATGTYEDETIFTKDYSITVISPFGEDYNTLTIPNADDIRGNITLPTTGENGSVITWESSNDEVVSVESKENEGYDAKPAGVVTRQDQDTNVVLTALLTLDGSTLTKEFELTVKAKAEVADTTDYLFAYFIGNGSGEEQIYFASSQNGTDWEELNEEKPVLESTMGTTGLRDPFIIRSAEGDKFYLIATDLCIAKDGNWTTAQQNGSQSIMVWESEDLVNWSAQRMVTVSAGINAGCTWAPEAFYDELTGEYVVFWASKVADDSYTKQRIYYCKTRDFYTFTEPQVWIDRSVSTIDTTVVNGNDGYIYRFSKNEGSGTVDGESVSAATTFLQRSKTLLGTWENVTSASLKSQSGVEGPTCFKFNQDDSNSDKWCLLLDNYGSGGYYPLTTDSLSGAVFAKITASLPSKPRHGTVLNITKEEYNTLMSAYSKETPDETQDEGNLLAEYDFSDEKVSGTTDGSTIEDVSGNGKTATIKGNGAAIADNVLTLPGGAAGSTAAYVSIPGTVFEGHDALTISLWLKNETGSGDYSAMFFGSKTKYYGEGTSTFPLNYWLLNPASPSGYFKSVWTKSNNASAPYNTETAASTTKTDAGWGMYTTVITADSITGYYNGVKVSTASKTNTTTDFGTGLVAALGRSGYNDKFYKGGVRNVKVYDAALSQDAITKEYNNGILAIDKEALTLGDTSAVTSDLELPATGSKGSQITWGSSNTEIITNDGKVTRPATDKNVNVTMTATLSSGDLTVTKEFTVTVVAANITNLFNEAVAALHVKSSTTDSIALPVTAGNIGETPIAIAWKSSNTKVLANDGTMVKRPASGEEDVTLTVSASISYNNGTVKLDAKKDFLITVRAKDYGYLMAYTNSTETTSLGMSLHLAYSTDNADYTALNSNTGICFANNAGGSKNSSPNGLASPYIFRKADGTYGMIARNSTSSSYIYAFDSTDLIHFTNERKLAVSSAVTTAPQCSYDDETGIYTIYWGDATNTYATTTKDFETVIETTTAAYTPTTVEKTGSWPDGATAGGVLNVSKTEYDRVVNKLGVVKNTGIEPVTVTADAGADIKSLLPKKVTANYSDGSTTDMNVSWNLSNVDLSKGGTYEITGAIKQTEYANPFIEHRADPCIFQGEDGYYYFTASYPMNGSSDTNGYDKVILRRATTIEGLQNATEVTIWDCDNSSTEYRYIWAPEFHYINGVYYIFYTSSISSGSVWSIRPHVLRCNNAADIMNPASWEAMGQMQAKSTDTQAFTGFSLDMTYFENNGHHYVMWAQTDGYSSLFIAEIDPDQPWKCVSDSVKISIPEYSWERINENVNEGPSVLIHDGKIYCTFSASGTGVEYCIGLLTADADADLLDVNSWVKQSYPILTSADVAGEYGPGHNSFTVDEDGNVIFVYHARGEACYKKQCQWASQNSLYDPCRDARIKRVHWAADGSPILKMTYSEELVSKTVKAIVTVKANTFYTLKYLASTGGSISGQTQQSVAAGKNATTVTAVPATGYRFVKWSDGVTTASRTDTKVTAGKTVTALFEPFAAKVTLNTKKITLGVKETYTLTAAVTPSNANAETKKVTWKTSNSKIATVSANGKITAKKTGKVKITATTGNGKTATCTVTVKAAPSKISLNATNKTLKKGKTFQVKVKLSKNSASNKITYTSSNKKVATVSASGKIKAIKKGTATITVKTFNGKSQKIKITVK